MDEEQAGKLLELIEGEDVQYSTMIKMFMFTGMRKEELCGLEWKDVDFKTSVIRIERASLYIPHEGIITDTTKNDSSTRYIKAPAIAIQLLKEYKRWQAQKRLSMGDRWVDCDRLFTKPDGTPIHPDTSSSSAVLGRHIRSVCLDLAVRLLLSPPRGARRGPRSVGSATLSKPTTCLISPSTACAIQTRP